MWVHLCAVNTVTTHRSQIGYISVSEQNFFFSRCLVQLLLCLPSLHIAIYTFSTSCLPPAQPQKPVAQLERQPGWERWYPPANKRLLCTTCSLPISTARCLPSSSEDLLPSTSKRKRIEIAKLYSQCIYRYYVCTFAGVLFLMYITYS